MELSEYLNITKIPVASFAKSAGVSRITVYDWISGKKKPSEENMATIIELTAGKTLPNDFYKIPNSKHNGRSHTKLERDVNSIST